MFQNLCSFCYICGKEFDFFELQFHQCPMFDSNKIADKVQDVLIDLTEEFPTIDQQSDLNKTSDSEATQTLTEQDHSTSNNNTPSQLLLPSTTPIACIDLTDSSDDAIETNAERSLVVNENNLIEDVVLPNNANNSDDDVNMAYNELNEVIQRINDNEGSFHGATVNLVKNVSLQNDETNIRHVEDKILPRKSINIISPVSVCPQNEPKIVLNSDDKSLDGGASTDKDDAQNSTPNTDSSDDVAHTRGKETDALIQNEVSSVNEEVSETITLEINEGVSDAPAQIIDDSRVPQSSFGIEGINMSTLRGSDQETSICLRLPTRPAAYLLCPHCDIILENDNALQIHQEFNHKEKLTSSTAYRETVKDGQQCQAKESIIEAISETEQQLCRNDKGNKENRSFSSDAPSLKSTLEFFKYCEDQNKSTKNSNLESRDDDRKMESTGHEKGHIDDNDAESSAANKETDLINILENSVDNSSAQESINLSKSTKTSNLMDTMESNSIAKDDVSTHTEKNRGSREASSKQIEQLNEIKKSVSKAGRTKEHEERINKSTKPTDKNDSIVESNAINIDEATVQQPNEASSISDKVTLVTKDLNLKPKAVDVHCSTTDKNHRKYKEESINLTKSMKISNLMDTTESNIIAKDDVSTHTEKNRGSREASSKQIEQLNEIKKSVSKAGKTKEHEERINKSTKPTDKNDSIVESNAISNDEATVQQPNEASSISDKVTLVTKDLNLKPKAVDVYCSTSDKNHRKYKENKVAKSNKVVSKTKLKKKHNVSKLHLNKDKDNTRKSHKKTVNKDDKLKNSMRVIKDCDIFSVSDEKTTSRQDLEDSKSKESHKKIKKTITIDEYKRQRLSITRKTIDENCQSDDSNLKTPERRLSSTEPIPVTPATGFSHQEMEIIHEVNQWLSDYQRESNSDAAQFSDEPDTNGENDQETATTIFCEACGLKTPNRVSLTNHMNELHPGFSFKCFVCDVACHSLDALINHLTKYAKSVLLRAESQFLRQRKSGPNQPYPYYCRLCGAGFTLIQLTMIHKRDCKGSSRKKSSKITKSTCEPVDDVVKSQSSYSSEEFIEDTRDQEDRCAEPPSPTFLEYCEFCGEKHKNLADKQKHLHIDTFKCLICRQHFEDLDQLARHYDLCHPKHDVINHEKTEYSIQKEFKYFCKFCGNKYYFISDLLSHKEVFHYDLVHGKSDPKNDDPSLTLEKIFEKPEKIPGLGDDNDDEVITVVESPSKANEVNHQVIDIDQENETNEKIVSTDPVDAFDVDSDADTVIVDLEDANSSKPLQKDPSEVFLDVHEYLKKQNINMGTDVNDELIDTISLSSSEEDRWDEAANQLANVLSDEYLLEDFDESPEEVQMSPSSNASPLIEQPNDSQIFCEVCGYECYNHEALSMHNTNNHNGFKCSLCGVHSKDIAALIQHQDQHQLESLQHAEEYTYSRMLNGNIGFYRYYCSSCGQGHKYITEMKVHKTSTCLRVPKGSSSPKSPQISNENVSSIEPKEVVEPITKITTPSNAPPLVEQPNDSQIFCEVCGYECYNHEALSIHNINNHNGFKCSLCGMHSKDIADLIQHQDQHQLESLQHAEEYTYSRMLNGNVGFYRYYCSSCGQGHKYINEMKVHKTSTCLRIPKGSSSPKLPQVSNENVSSIEPKEVIKRTTKTTTPSNAPPLIEQPNDSQIFCEVCGYECYNHEALSIHNANNHNGFRCSLCGMHSKDIADLIQHQDQHQLKSVQNAEENTYSRMLKANVGFYRYYCSSCGQGHKYITEMKIHKSSTCSAMSKSSSPKISNENVTAVEPKEVVKPTTKTKKMIICPHCHQDFDYWHLLNEHRAKGCSVAQAASQESTSCLLTAIKNNSQQVPTTAVVDNGIKATSDSINDSKGSTNDHEPEQHRLKKLKPTLQVYAPPKKFSQNWPVKKARKTFTCHVCHNKLFISEAALRQHSKTSSKHKKLLKKISSLDGKKGEPLTARTSVRNETNIASERRITFRSPRTSSTQSKNLKKRKGRRSRSRSGGRDTTKRRRSNDSSSNNVSRNNDKNRSKVKSNANEEVLDGIYSLEDAKKLCS